MMIRSAMGLRPAVFLAFVVVACGGDVGRELGGVVTVVPEGASNPTVAAGADGVFYIAWVGAPAADGMGGEGEGLASDRGMAAGAPGGGAGGHDVWLARSEDGVVFSQPVRVNDVPGDAAPHEQAPAQVAAGEDGLVVVVWQNNRQEPGRRFPYSDLRMARSVDGGRTFARAVTVNDDAGGPPSSHTFHDVTMGPDGEVVVSWIDSRERTRLEAEMAAAGAAVPADMHAVHGEEAALPGPEIRLARSMDGGVSFVPSVVVASDACPCCRTSLEVVASGETAVAWRGAEAGDVRDIMVARAAAGEFGEPVVVHADGWRIDGCPHAGPAIALDGAGRLHAAWYTGAEGREGLYYAASEAGGGFGEPYALIGGGDFVPVSQVKMAALAGGDDVLVAWEDRRDGTIAVGLGDGARVRTIGPAGSGTSPAVAAGGVAWLDGGAVRFVQVR